MKHGANYSRVVAIDIDVTFCLTRVYMAPQKNDPLHGVTLKMQVEELVERYGWEGLGAKIKIKCFIEKPSINSSLTFLRKTPWAREKVVDYYFWTFYKRDGSRK